MIVKKNISCLNIHENFIEPKNALYEFFIMESTVHRSFSDLINFDKSTPTTKMTPQDRQSKKEVHDYIYCKMGHVMEETL